MSDRGYGRGTRVYSGQEIDASVDLQRQLYGCTLKELKTRLKQSAHPKRCRCEDCTGLSGCDY